MLPDGDELAVVPFELSALQRTLEDVWNAMRDHHPELPDVVVLVGPGTEGRRLRKLGHWAAFRWRVHGESGPENVGELLLAGERLRDGPSGVLETLLHEAAHALATVRRLKDTSREGRYHNRVYKRLAEEVGLVVTHDETYGWAMTDLGDGASERYEAELVMIGLALGSGGWRRRPGEQANGADGGAEAGGDASAGKGRGARQTRALYVCACSEPRRIRVSPGIADLGPIECGLCRAPFTRTPEAGAPA